MAQKGGEGNAWKKRHHRKPDNIEPNARRKMEERALGEEEKYGRDSEPEGKE
jgi:hypothetical protein